MSLQAIYEQGEDVYVSLPHELRYPDHKRKDVILDEPTDLLTQGEIELYPITEESVESTAIPSCIGRETKPPENDKIVKDHVQLKKEMTTLGVRTAIEVQVDQEAVVTSEIHKQLTHSSSSGTENSKNTGESAVASLVKERPRDVEVEPEQATKEAICTDDSTMTSPSLDRALSVGKKNVVIDLLEAMEVVTPNIEGKILLEKLEKLTGINLENLEKQSVILERVKKLKNRLKSFHEKAAMKKQTSIKKMEELANRDHYAPVFGDEKTLIQLELLFQAMRNVLQADRDMRTGKGLMDNKEENTGPLENPLTNDSSSVHPCNGCEYKEKSENDSTEVTENEVKDEPRKWKEKTSHKAKPPDDPPPPHIKDSANLEAKNQAKNITDSKDSEGQNRNALVSNHEADKNMSISWLSIPYIYAWRDAENSTLKPENSSLSSDSIIETEVADTPDPQFNDKEDISFIAQAWYVSLGWIFHSESKIDNQEKDSEVYAQHKQENSSVSKGGCDETQSSKWYWYPVTGVYRLYSWVLSASKVNA